MMTLSEFLIPSSEYAARRGPEDVIVLSSRARLARNLCDSSFPAWAKKPERLQILKRISDAVLSLPPMKSCLMESMDNLSNNDKLALMERHLISREHTGRGAGSGLAINKEENISVMINEEDHLRMQAILPGFQIRKVWERIDQLDSELEKKIPYAFHPEYGYLTACPTNLGTGIRVSAMLHLPGLALTDQISQIVGAVNKLGLAVRGIYGEGTDALGNLFQASNQMTLGETEEDIVIRLEKVIRQVVKNEENARQTLLEEKDQITLLNHIGRAWGILSNCYTIETRETLNLLSFIRLGIDLGMFPKGKRSDLEELFLITQRGHLQLAAKENMDAPQRDRARADILRKKILKLKAPQKVKLKALES